MCRTWPGPRCSTHPSQKVRETYRRLGNTRQRLTKLQAEYTQWQEANPDWENDTTNITMLERIESAEKAMATADDRHEEALREWDMTAKGRESLQEVADDETNSLPERVDAASRKEAAQHRASEQRGLRAPLEAADLDDETKFAIANLNLKNSRAEVAVLQNRQAAIEQELAVAKENMAAAKQARNEEAVKQWQDRYAQLTMERNLNKRKIAQILSHIQKLEQHIAKMRAELLRKIDKVGVLSERGVRKAVQYLL